MHRHKQLILRNMYVFIIPVAIIVLVVIINLARLAGQLGGYQAYWTENNKKPAPTDAITYVALGDSSAQSIGASSPDKGYVGLIAQAIRDKTGKPVRVINLSKSGAKIDHVITDQLPKLTEYNVPSNTIYTLQIGANNAVRDFDIAGFERDMNKLLPLLPKNIIMSDIPSFQRTRFSKADEHAVKANERLYELVKPYGIELVPLYETTHSRASWRNNAIDIFHPNNRGYKNWFDAFWGAVAPKIQ